MTELLETYNERDSTVIIRDLDRQDEDQLFPEMKYQRYITDYCENVNSALCDFTIQEKRPKLFPFIVEIKVRDDTLTHDEINNLVRSLQLYVKENYVLTSKEKEKTCVVLKTESTWVHNKSKFSRYMFHFPYCRISRDYNRGDIETMVSELIYRKFDIQPQRQFYPLFGSILTKDTPVLIFHGVYSPKGAPMDLKDTYRPTDHSLFDNDIEVREQLFEDKDEEAMYHLPIFLSAYFSKNETKSRSEEDGDSLSDGVGDGAEALCSTFLPMINQSRFTKNYDDIGKAVYNSYEDKDIGFRVFMDIMERKTDLVGDVNKGEIRTSEAWRRHFDSYENHPGVTVKTLAWYSKFDSPRRYRDWHIMWVREAMDASFEDKEDEDFAKVFYRLLWLDYMYDSKSWYRFAKGRLIRLGNQTTMYQDIVNIVSRAYIDYKAALEEQGRRFRTNSERDDVQTKLDSIPKVTKKLKSSKTKAGTAKQAGLFFYNDFCDVPLVNLIDMNPDLLGCKGNVLELRSTGAFCRQGKPEDYITMSTGVAYKHEYTLVHPDVVDFINYMKKVYPNRKIRDYAYLDNASLLRGGNYEKILRVLIGETNGSKSIYQKIGHKAFGQYSAVVPETYWSGDNRSSGPSPEKAQLKYARVAYAFEIPNNKSLDNTDIKRSTGGDLTYARNCGEDGGAIEIKNKFILSVNGFPDIKGLDYAAKARIFMMPHQSEFVLKTKEEDRYNELSKLTLEEQMKLKQFPADDISDEKLLIHAGVFLWLAVQMYKKYVQEGLVPPKRIKKYINDYWQRHDPLMVFLKDYIVEDETGDIKKKEIFKAYSRWHNDSSFPYKQMSMDKFMEAMEGKDKLGPSSRGGWIGWRLLDREEDESNFY